MKMGRNSQMSPFIKQCYVTATVDLSSVCFGASLGFPAILLPQLRAPRAIIALTKEAESWIASVFALGMLFGYFLTPAAAERLGRRATHLLVCSLFVASWLITTLAADIQVLIIGRTLQGIAGGMMSTLGTILVGECTSPRNRGAFLASLTLSQSTGVLLVHSMGSLFSWQKTALVCSFFPFVSLVMTIFTPESPSWLLSRGKYDKFEEVFRWFRGNVEEAELMSMLQANSAKQEAAKTDTGNHFFNLKEIIIKKEFFKPIVIMIHSNCLLQFAGGSILMTYSTVVVNLLMGPTANVYLWTVFMDVWRLFANVVAIFVVYKFDRRTMLFSSGGLCVLCHVVLAGYLYGSSEGWISKSMWMPLLFLSMLLFANAVGIAPIRNVIAGEVFPLRYRSVGGSISFASGSCMMFLVLKTFPALLDSLRLHGAYTVYGSVVAFSLVVLWFMLPETKGRTLQQIENQFKGLSATEPDTETTKKQVETVKLPI